MAEQDFRVRVISATKDADIERGVGRNGPEEKKRLSVGQTAASSKLSEHRSFLQTPDAFLLENSFSGDWMTGIEWRLSG